MEVLGLLAFMMPLYGLAVWVFTAWMSGHVAPRGGEVGGPAAVPSRNPLGQPW